MRALIFELRPESLEREGLVDALRRQALAVEARHGISAEVTSGEQPKLSREVTEELYRIVQEALHNTVKHARARNAEVRLEHDNGTLVLTIRDDGAGFDTSGDFPGHLGLRSMRERAACIGGTLQVQSTPGEGTSIRVRVPC